MQFVKWTFVPAVCLCATAAFADRLIDIPVGKKVPNRVVRLEGEIRQGTRDYRGLLDLGLNAYVDATVHHDSFSGNKALTSFDFSYNYIAPITDIAPGISLGVQDISNKTDEGRRGFFATTYRLGGIDTFTPNELTIGAQVGKTSSAFLGILIPATPTFRLMAEHDGQAINAGFEYRPNKQWAARWIYRDGRPSLTLRIQHKF